MQFVHFVRCSLVTPQCYTYSCILVSNWLCFLTFFFGDNRETNVQVADAQNQYKRRVPRGRDIVCYNFAQDERIARIDSRRDVPGLLFRELSAGIKREAGLVRVRGIK